MKSGLEAKRLRGHAIYVHTHIFKKIFLKRTWCANSPAELIGQINGEIGREVAIEQEPPLESTLQGNGTVQTVMNDDGLRGYLNDGPDYIKRVNQ